MLLRRGKLHRETLIDGERRRGRLDLLISRFSGAPSLVGFAHSEGRAYLCGRDPTTVSLCLLWVATASEHTTITAQHSAFSFLVPYTHRSLV